MKVLIWHGYLLGGTGSNVYTRSLARAWSRLGHEVVVFCQEPHPELYDLAGARVVRPELDGGPLPVFVLDRYEDLEPRYLQDLTPEERREFVERNAAAVREHLPADFLLTNHVLLGAPVGAAVGMPFAVKAHGSELEFSIRGNEDLVRWAREALAQAQSVLAGSRHMARALAEVIGPGEYLERVQVVPPGVDVEEFRPEERGAAFAALLEEARRDPPNPGRRNERLPDPGNAERLASFLAGEERTVVYVGKLSREKGVHLLLAALPRERARAVVVGFGPERDELEAAAGDRVLFTGPLEHRHLVHLLPLADASVTPSVFPEAFGMVAAEAAAAGSPPLLARHSGLAEIAEGLEREYPREHRELASFATGNADDLAAKLDCILALPERDWRSLSEAARRAAVKLWSWERTAALILSSGWERRSA
ncbi:MAG: glycosyltransferase family 4 protein [Actinomycetota bacterium]|nr:glycosyltransferase family 4 protein [Actinomycetota bacterium]